METEMVASGYAWKACLEICKQKTIFIDNQGSYAIFKTTNNLG